MEAMVIDLLWGGAVLAGTFLAIVFAAPMMGIAWDILANR